MINAQPRIRRLLTIHLLLFVILFARRPDVLTRAQFWAEDGAVFFAEQLRFGFLHALSSTYAGYYVVVPRLIAGAAAALPAKYVPFTYNLSALLLTSLCCGLFAWPICRHLIASDVIRTVCCFVAAAAFYGGGEVLGNLTNLQWFLLVAAIILTSYQQTIKTGPPWVYVALACADLLMSLTAPLLLVLVPWLLWQAVRKEGFGRLPAVCALAGTLFQAYTFLASSEPHGALHKFNFSSLFVAVIGAAISRPVLATFIGHQYLLKGAAVGVLSKLIAALTIVSAGITQLYLSFDSRRRRLLGAVLYLFLAPIAIVILGRNLITSFTDPVQFRNVHGERYFIAAGFLFVYLTAVCVNSIFHRRNDTVKAAVLLLLFSYGTARNFKVEPLVDFSWNTYASVVDNWTVRHNRGEHLPRLTIPINPPSFVMNLE